MTSYHTKNKYKYCVVPKCKSTTASSPGKYFIRLPKDKKKRIIWQQAMRRAELLKENTGAYTCQDHFKLEEDAENYVKFKLMPNVKIKLKQGVVPRFFECQTRIEAGITRSQFSKRKRQETIEESTDQKKLKIDLKTNQKADMPEEENLEQLPKEYKTTAFKSIGVQVNLKPLSKSKLIQCSLSQSSKKLKVPRF